MSKWSVGSERAQGQRQTETRDGRGSERGERGGGIEVTVGRDRREGERRGREEEDPPKLFPFFLLLLLELATLYIHRETHRERSEGEGCEKGAGYCVVRGYAV